MAVPGLTGWLPTPVAGTRTCRETPTKMTDKNQYQGESVLPGLKKNFERSGPAPTSARVQGAVAPERAGSQEGLIRLLAKLVGDGLEGP